MSSPANESPITWTDVQDIVASTPGALGQLLVHLEGAGKISKELSKHINKDSSAATSTDAPTVLSK